MNDSFVFEVDSVLKRIAEQIVARGLSASEWSVRESDDEFDDGGYRGGFDADEQAFCFAVDRGRSEYWFQLTLSQVAAVAAGDERSFAARPADK